MILNFYKKIFFMFSFNVLFLLNIFILYLNLNLIFYAKNPIYSIIFLMLSFLNISIFLLYLGIEFFALLILIIYVGAISILFLFVIMLIDIKEVLLLKKQNFIFINILILCIGMYFILFYFFNYLNLDINNSGDTVASYKEWFNLAFFYKSDLSNLGLILFNFYYLAFIEAGIILLIAMIGCIALVIDENFISKKQYLFEQILTNNKKNLNLY